jgi:hypothetical protein
VRQRRRDRAQRIHSVHRREASHQPDDWLGERAASRQLRLQISKLSARRQASMPQEEADLFERGELREIVDVVPAVREHAALAIEITNRRRRGDDVLEPALRFLCSGH